MTEATNEVNHVKQMQINLDEMIKNSAAGFNQWHEEDDAQFKQPYMDALNGLFSLANNLREYLNEPMVVHALAPNEQCHSHTCNQGDTWPIPPMRSSYLDHVLKNGNSK